MDHRLLAALIIALKRSGPITLTDELIAEALQSTVTVEPSVLANGGQVVSVLPGDPAIQLGYYLKRLHALPETPRTAAEAQARNEAHRVIGEIATRHPAVFAASIAGDGHHLTR